MNPLTSVSRRAPLLAAAILLSCAPLPAQKLDVTVAGLDALKGVLSSISGEVLTKVDDVNAAAPGRFTYDMAAKECPPGMYRLTFDRNVRVDFLYDRDDVTLSTDAANVSDSMNVIVSGGNRLYYAFGRLNRAYKTKSELLGLILARYPADDAYYATTKSTLAGLQAEYSSFVRKAAQEKPASFAARYIRSAQMTVIPETVPPDRQLEYLKAHALDSVDFSDDDLVRSDLFTSKAIEYLTYYRNPTLTKDLLEKELNRAVDSILTRARVDEAVYQPVTQYLIQGFKTYGFDRCIDYIVEHYVVRDNLCLDESTGGSIAKMVEQKKLFTPGTVLPAIALPDSTGKTVDITKHPAERFLILFYSAGCPHCRDMVPKLREAYDRRKTKETEVLAVSLDPDRTEWLTFLREQGLTWPSVSDLLGWNSPVVAAYHIYATPTMVVVDKNMRMIAEPKTVEEAMQWF
jgi:peroxiredoxin